MTAVEDSSSKTFSKEVGSGELMELLYCEEASVNDSDWPVLFAIGISELLSEEL